MAISTVVQRGAFVYVHNDRGQQIAVLMAGSSPGDGLIEHSPTSVSIQRRGHIYTYDDTGRIQRTVPVPVQT